MSLLKMQLAFYKIFGSRYFFVNIRKQSNAFLGEKFLLMQLSQGVGECYATTSMRKVELILKFNSLSGSIFLSRLVLQVISVPFVV